MTQFQPGDIVFTRNPGVIGRLIRRFTRTIGESRTQCNHVAVVVKGGDRFSAVIVEALHTVKHHTLFEGYGEKRDLVAIFRPNNLLNVEEILIINKALGYVGRRYGYLKILLHFLDWFLLGAYVFRRLGRMDNYPICSYLVAHAYAAADKTFGVAPGAATPDDIWDFCAQSGKFWCVRHFNPVRRIQ